MRPALVALALAALLPVHSAAARTLPETNGVLIQLRDTAPGTKHLQNADRARLLSHHAGSALHMRNGPAPGTRLVRAFQLNDKELARRLAAAPTIAHAVPNRRITIQQQTAPAANSLSLAPFLPNDPLFNQSFHPSLDGFTVNGTPIPTPTSTLQWTLQRNEWPASINAVDAWNLSKGAGIVIAVIDSGIRPSHPDLQGQLLPGYDFITDDSVAVDNQPGRDGDPTDPGDYDRAPAAGDDPPISSWHGTKVAGIIGARGNNGIGIAGLAWEAKILPIRVIGSGGGYTEDLIAAMRWAVGLPVDGVPDNLPENRAKILNLSLGTDNATCDPIMQAAIDEITGTGALITAAAGNIGQHVDMPANCRNVIAVGSARVDGVKTSYSNYGSEIGILAPGGDCGRFGSFACQFQITTTSNSGITDPDADNYTDDPSRDYIGGTSFATPLVSGALALIWSANPSLTPDEVVRTLYGHATSHPSQHGTPMSETIGLNDEEPLSTCDPNTITIPPSACICTATTCGHGLLNVYSAVLATANHDPIPALADTTTETPTTPPAEEDTPPPPDTATEPPSTPTDDTPPPATEPSPADTTTPPTTEPTPAPDTAAPSPSAPEPTTPEIPTPTPVIPTPTTDTPTADIPTADTPTADTPTTPPPQSASPVAEPSLPATEQPPAVAPTPSTPPVSAPPPAASGNKAENNSGGGGAPDWLALLALASLTLALRRL